MTWYVPRTWHVHRKNVHEKLPNLMALSVASLECWMQKQQKYTDWKWHPHWIKCTINLNFVITAALNGSPHVYVELLPLAQGSVCSLEPWNTRGWYCQLLWLKKVTLICEDIMSFFVSTLMAHADKWRQNERCKSESSLLFVRAHLLDMRRSSWYSCWITNIHSRNLCEHFCKTRLGISSILCWTLTSRKKSWAMLQRLQCGTGAKSPKRRLIQTLIGSWEQTCCLIQTRKLCLKSCHWTPEVKPDSSNYTYIYIYERDTAAWSLLSLSQGKILSASCPIPKQTYQTQTTLNITNLKFSKWSLK